MGLPIGCGSSIGPGFTDGSGAGWVVSGSVTVTSFVAGAGVVSETTGSGVTTGAGSLVVTTGAG